MVLGRRHEGCLPAACCSDVQAEVFGRRPRPGNGHCRQADKALEIERQEPVLLGRQVVGRWPRGWQVP